MGAIYFWLISKNWRPFEIFGLCLGALSLSSVIWMPESPKYLISQGKAKEAILVYKKIARVNGKVFNEILFNIERRRSTIEFYKN